MRIERLTERQFRLFIEVRLIAAADRLHGHLDLIDGEYALRIAEAEAEVKALPASGEVARLKVSR